MADSAISGLTAVTTPAGTDQLAVNQGGTSKRLTLSQVNAYCEPVCNAAVADQSPFTTERYLDGSKISIPDGRIQAGSYYECEFNVVKTAAGVAAPVINIRVGTLGAVGDTAILVLTHSAQTAVADEGIFKVYATWRAIGSGTTAVIRGTSSLYHEKGFGSTASTGLSVNSMDVVTGNSSGFNSTTSALFIGIGVVGGTSASWTVSTVHSKLLNLT